MSGYNIGTVFQKSPGFFFTNARYGIGKDYCKLSGLIISYLP